MSVKFYPELIGLTEDEIKVVATMGRVAVPEGTITAMDQMDDRELAASLLGLQTKGYLTLLVDEDGNPEIRLNKDRETARAEYASRQAQRRPSRRERRARRRRG